jgi:uncharacterized protein YaiL (DUF2058 family)
MSDMREALRKAGLVSEKEARRSKHQERVHRKEVGAEGLEKERVERERKLAREREEKRRKDRSLEEEKRRAEERPAPGDPPHLVATGVVRGAVGGGKRFYFVAAGGRITYLDLTDLGLQLVQNGSGAIVETLGAVPGEFCVVGRATAAALSAGPAKEAVRCWEAHPESPGDRPRRESRGPRRDR